MSQHNPIPSLFFIAGLLYNETFFCFKLKLILALKTNFWSVSKFALKKG